MEDEYYEADPVRRKSMPDYKMWIQWRWSFFFQRLFHLLCRFWNCRKTMTPPRVFRMVSPLGITQLGHDLTSFQSYKHSRLVHYYWHRWCWKHANEDVMLVVTLPARLISCSSSRSSNSQLQRLSFFKCGQQRVMMASARLSSSSTWTRDKLTWASIAQLHAALGS